MRPLEPPLSHRQPEFPLGQAGLDPGDSLAIHLEKQLTQRPGVVGLGSWNWGDDAAGLLVARQLTEQGYPHVLACESASTRWMQFVSSSRFEQVVLIDAVEAGQAPGSVICLEDAEVQTRYPQVSTHKFSLGLMARWIRLHGVARVLLLGIQPSCLREASPVSPLVQTTAAGLAGLLARLLWSRSRAASPTP